MFWEPKFQAKNTPVGDISNNGNAVLEVETIVDPNSPLANVKRIRWTNDKTYFLPQQSEALERGIAANAAGFSSAVDTIANLAERFVPVYFEYMDRKETERQAAFERQNQRINQLDAKIDSILERLPVPP